MAGQHADGEILAQLAMDSPVPVEVSAHVAACPECSRDLSLLKSLLAADGPDTPSTADPAADAGDDPVPPMADAMADGNDARQAERSGGGEFQQAPVQEVPSAVTESNSGINPTALVAALVIFVGAALLAFVALR